MARLRQKQKTGDLYLIISRGNFCTNHSLNSYGAERLKRLGYEVGHFVHRDVLEILDQNLECQPPCGKKGQLQLIWEAILKVAKPTPTVPQRAPRWAKILRLNFNGLVQQEFCFQPEPSSAGQRKAA